MVYYTTLSSQTFSVRGVERFTFSQINGNREFGRKISLQVEPGRDKLYPREQDPQITMIRLH